MTWGDRIGGKGVGDGGQESSRKASLCSLSQVSGREAAVIDMLKLCRLSTARRTALLSPSLSFATAAAPARARILITSVVADAEALSACEVFQLMLQARLHVECAVVHARRQMASWKYWAYYLVVLLVRGIAHDPGFVRILLASTSDRHLELVSVMADSHFDFPSDERLETDSDDDLLGERAGQPFADAACLMFAHMA